MDIVIKETIAREVMELAGIRKGSRSIRNSKAYRVVGAITDSITNALLRGERVSIQGFGIFEIATRPPQNKYCTYFYNDKGMSSVIEHLPERKYIKFKPSKVLVRMINEGERNEPQS